MMIGLIKPGVDGSEVGLGESSSLSRACCPYAADPASSWKAEPNLISS